METQAARERLEAVLSSISDAFATLDRGWRFTFVNDQVAEMAGMPADAMLGRSIWDLFPGAVGGTAHDHFRKAIRSGAAVRLDSFAPHAGPVSALRSYPPAPPREPPV